MGASARLESFRTQSTSEAAIRARALLSIGAGIVGVLSVSFSQAMLLGLLYAPVAGLCVARLWNVTGRRAVLVLVPLAALAAPALVHRPAAMVSLFAVCVFLLTIVTGVVMRAGGAVGIVASASVFGLAAFAANGADVLVALGVVLAFPAVAAAGAYTLAQRRDGADWSARWLLALLFAFAATWAGVALVVTKQPPGLEAWQAWTARFGAGDEHYRTMMVAGFPLQVVEGHGGGGAPEWLPWTKGLWGLLLNFGIWTGLGLVLALPCRRAMATTATCVAAVPALIVGLLGWWQLLVMLD